MSGYNEVKGTNDGREVSGVWSAARSHNVLWMAVTPGVSLRWENKININILIITFLDCKIRLTSPMGEITPLTSLCKGDDCCAASCWYKFELSGVRWVSPGHFLFSRTKIGHRSVHLFSP